MQEDEPARPRFILSMGTVSGPTAQTYLVVPFCPLTDRTWRLQELLRSGINPDMHADDLLSRSKWKLRPSGQSKVFLWLAAHLLRQVAGLPSGAIVGRSRPCA